MSLFRTLRQMVEDDAQELYESHKEWATLVIVKYLSRIASAVLIGVLWMVIAAVVVILLGISLGFLLGNLVGSNALGFLLSAVAWCVVGVVLHLFRHKLVENPIVVKLRKIFFGK